MKTKITNKITTPVLAILALIVFGATVTTAGQWWLLQSTAGISMQQFGLAGDKPVQSAFIP